MALTIRRATPDDVSAASLICYNAFQSINNAHNFPPDLPTPEFAQQLMSMLFSQQDHFHCIVAEEDGRVVGSNILDERSIISGVGPITVDPSAQNHGVGRLLMQAVLDRAAAQRAPGVRLVQAAFHCRSLSLYASLGFDIREPLACLQGTPTAGALPGLSVRTATADDIPACNAVSLAVHGFARGTELAHGIHMGHARVVERHGRITGYASVLGFFGHSTAETNLDLQALLASAESFLGPGILLPTRNSSLFRWCLANGPRVIQPMTLMSLGLYNEPRGAFLPSVSF